MARRSDKSWMEYDEASTPFLSPDSDEATASIAAELRDRMSKVEQQVLAQYTATAAYATLGQQAVDQARAESRADLDRLQATSGERRRHRRLAGRDATDDADDDGGCRSVRGS